MVPRTVIFLSRLRFKNDIPKCLIHKYRNTYTNTCTYKYTKTAWPLRHLRMIEMVGLLGGVMSVLNIAHTHNRIWHPGEKTFFFNFKILVFWKLLRCYCTCNRQQRPLSLWPSLWWEPEEIQLISSARNIRTRQTIQFRNWNLQIELHLRELLQSQMSAPLPRSLSKLNLGNNREVIIKLIEIEVNIASGFQEKPDMSKVL